MLMNSKLYNILKFTGRILVPAACTLYATLSSIWGLPFVEEVVGTGAAITAFLNAFLEYSSAKYKVFSESMQESITDYESTLKEEGGEK